jgi:RHO protein GDP dissociation inhibitor
MKGQHVCYFILFYFVLFVFVDNVYYHLAKDDPRRVVIKEMKVLFEDRPGGDVTYPLESKAELENMKKTPFVLKEGCHYKIRVVFKVQHEIVSGLKYVNAVYRKGLKGIYCA